VTRRIDEFVLSSTQVIPSLDHPQQEIQRHRRHQRVVLHLFSTRERQATTLEIDRFDGAPVVHPLGGQLASHTRPDRPCSTAERKTKRGVGSPTDLVPAMHDVGEDSLQIDRRDPFSHPPNVEAIRRVRPHLEVVGIHEHVAKALAELLKEPLVERLRPVRRAGVHQVDQPVEARREVLFR
jgi:hypothetical protein